MNTKILLVIAITLCISCKKEKQNVIPTAKTLEIKGGDMSYLPEIRQSGVVFKNADNLPEDMLVTLKNSGANVVRLRLFKDPAEPNSGYNTVKFLAAEIKNRGMKLMLSVHYSDDWADPSKQTKPNAWKSLTFAQLQDSVYAYTYKVVEDMAPDYIQIGNEINNGLLWPDGNLLNLQQMKWLLQKGISAVRDARPDTKIILHYADYEGAASFFAGIAGLDYDIIGLSYYPLWHGKNLTTLQQALTDISTAQRKPIFIAETSYPFTLGWNDWTNNVIGDTSQILTAYPATPTGQKDYLNKIKQITLDVPKAIGFCYWGAEWASVRGPQASNGSTWENQAFWDFDNKSLPVLEVYK